MKVSNSGMRLPRPRTSSVASPGERVDDERDELVRSVVDGLGARSPSRLLTEKLSRDNGLALLNGDFPAISLTVDRTRVAGLAAGARMDRGVAIGADALLSRIQFWPLGLRSQRGPLVTVTAGSATFIECTFLAGEEMPANHLVRVDVGAYAQFVGCVFVKGSKDTAVFVEVAGQSVFTNCVFTGQVQAGAVFTNLATPDDIALIGCRNTTGQLYGNVRVVGAAGQTNNGLMVYHEIAENLVVEGGQTLLGHNQFVSGTLTLEAGAFNLLL